MDVRLPQQISKHAPLPPEHQPSPVLNALEKRLQAKPDAEERGRIAKEMMDFITRTPKGVLGPKELSKFLFYRPEMIDRIRAVTLIGQHRLSECSDFLAEYLFAIADRNFDDNLSFPDELPCGVALIAIGDDAMPALIQKLAKDPQAVGITDILLKILGNEKTLSILEASLKAEGLTEEQRKNLTTATQKFKDALAAEQ